MRQFTVDFSQIPSNDVVAGEYEVTVTKAEVRDSQSSDHPYINLELTISEGPMEKRKIWDILSFSPNALFKMKGILDLMGYKDIEAVNFETDDSDQVTNPVFVGLAFKIDTKVEKYQDQDRLRVKKYVECYNPNGPDADSGDLEDLEDDEDEDE